MQIFPNLLQSFLLTRGQYVLPVVLREAEHLQDHDDHDNDNGNDEHLQDHDDHDNDNGKDDHLGNGEPALVLARLVLRGWRPEGGEYYRKLKLEIPTQ